MPTRNELQRLETMLGEQLGLNPYGEPLYKWVQAGQHKVPIVHMVGGQVQKTWEPNQAGILIPKPIIKLEKMAFWLEDEQWVMTRWFYTPLEQWQLYYNGLLPFPERGIYYPGNAHLPPWEVPNAGNTDQFIQQVKKDRLVSFDEWVQRSEAALDRAERRNDNKVDAMLRDTMTAFGSAKPGARGGHYSFGGTKQENA